MHAWISNHKKIKLSEKQLNELPFLVSWASNLERATTTTKRIVNCKGYFTSADWVYMNWKLAFALLKSNSN